MSKRPCRVDLGGRYSFLFRPNLACMAVSPHSDGKTHAQEMAQSGIRRTPSFLSYRRRHAPGRHHFTRDCEYDARWARTAAYLPLLKDEQSRKASKSQPDT